MASRFMLFIHSRWLVTGNNFTFEAEIEPINAGSFKTGVRMYPKNDKLPHRQDFCYVKWLN